MLISREINLCQCAVSTPLRHDGPSSGSPWRCVWATGHRWRSAATSRRAATAHSRRRGRLSVV